MSFVPEYLGTNRKLMVALQELATKDTAEYFYHQTNQPEFIPTPANHIPDSFDMLDESKKQLRELCFDHAKLEGYVAEFGVDQGKSFLQLCEHYRTEFVYGFDAFRGLPDGGAWPGNLVHKGMFDYNGELQFEVPENGRIIAGWFDDTLPRWDMRHERVAKFVHIDCDVYSSTVTILENLHGSIVPGTVIVFDDYCNHTNWRQGEWKAWQEYTGTHSINYKYLYCAGMSVGLIVVE